MKSSAALAQTGTMNPAPKAEGGQSLVSWPKRAKSAAVGAPSEQRFPDACTHVRIGIGLIGSEQRLLAHPQCLPDAIYGAFLLPAELASVSIDAMVRGPRNTLSANMDMRHASASRGFCAIASSRRSSLVTSVRLSDFASIIRLRSMPP